MDPIFEAYISAQRRRRNSPLTLKAVAHALGTAQRWLDQEQVTAAELGLLDCEHYFDMLLQRSAVSTVRRHLAYLRAAYAYAIRHDLAAHDPTAEVRLPRLPDRQPATYTNAELRRIHAAIGSQRDEAAFFLFAFAALRLGELSELTWRQVDLEHLQLHVNGKGGKPRLVPLHPVLHTVLLEHLRGASSDTAPVVSSRGSKHQHLAARTLGREIRALVDRANVPIDMPSHAFRRTAATVMYEHGVRTRVIERIMGWAPRQMHARHYLRVADDAMRQAILTLYRDDPISDRQDRTLAHSLRATSTPPGRDLAAPAATPR